MKVLIINGTDINKPASGSGVVLKQFLEYVPNGLDVTLFNIGEDVCFSFSNVDSIYSIPNKHHYLWERLIPVFTFTSLMYSHYLADIKVLQKIKNVIELNKYDVIYYHDTIAMRYYFPVYGLSQQCHLIDLHSSSYSYYVGSSKSLFKKFFYQRERFFCDKYERKIINKYDCIYVVNSDEAVLANEKYHTDKYFGVNLGADLNTGFLEVNKNNESFRFVYIGNLNYKANFDGLDYFIKKYFRSSTLTSQCELHIIGPGSEKVDYDDENIFTYGFVDDLKELLSIMHLGVATMVNGSGMKNKLFDYLRFGVPALVNSYTFKSNFISSEYVLKLDSAEELNHYIENYDYSLDPNLVRDSINRYNKKLSSIKFWNNLIEKVKI